MRRNLMSVSTEGAATVVEVHGALDLESTDSLRALLAQLRRESDVIVEIRHVDFCDSSGISVLATAARDAQLNGHEVTVRHAHPSVEHILRLTGCDWLLQTRGA